MSSTDITHRISSIHHTTSRTAVPAIISKFESQAQSQAGLGFASSSNNFSNSRSRPTSLPQPVINNPFPSPPLSASASPVYAIRPSDPWQEDIGVVRVANEEGEKVAAIVMDSLGTSSALEGSWRFEGDHQYHGHQRLPSAEYRKEGDLIWDIQNVSRTVPDGAEVGQSHGNGYGYGKGRRTDHSSAPSPQAARDIPMNIAVWADVMDTSKGRDKVLKCAQYSMRTYLYLLSLIAAVRPLSPWFKANSKRTRLAVTGLSLTRKCLLLLNPLHPLTHILSPEPTSAPSLIQHLIDLFSAISDDIYCLSRLGIVNKRVGVVADRWANRFWFLTTVINLYTLHLKTLPSLRSSLALIPSKGSEKPWTTPSTTSPRKLRKDLTDAEWTSRKLLADLIFVSYEVFNVNLLREPVQCVAGLIAALISTNKIYDKHWTSSLGKG